MAVAKQLEDLLLGISLYYTVVMGSIADILAKKDFSEPPEIKLIKDFVKDKFQSEVNITIHPRQIIISAPSASLIGTLRMHSHELSQACKTDKRLVFRIG